MAALRSRVRFAEFVFDPDTGELTGPHGTTRLQPQPALVLQTLVARVGELVTRDELKRIVWPDTVVEADQGLNYCIRQIRTALGDEAESGRLIETLPRRGYRFTRQVDPIELDASNAAASVGQHVARASAIPPTRIGDPPRWRRIAIVAGAALVALGGAFIIARSASSSSAPRSVAVLPLTTPNGADWALRLNQQVSDRLVEFLTNSESPRWSVVGPVTTEPYASDPRPHTDLGARLGVAYVVSGGVRLSDSTLFVQAVRSRDGSHVFAWRGKTAGQSADSVFQALATALTRGAGGW